MIRYAGYAWEIAAAWFLLALAAAACWAGYRAIGKRRNAARKRAVLHSIEHPKSVVPIVRGHAYPLPRKDPRP